MGFPYLLGTVSPGKTVSFPDLAGRGLTHSACLHAEHGSVVPDVWDPVVSCWMLRNNTSVHGRFQIISIKIMAFFPNMWDDESTWQIASNRYTGKLPLKFSWNPTYFRRLTDTRWVSRPRPPNCQPVAKQRRRPSGRMRSPVVPVPDFAEILPQYFGPDLRYL